MNTEWLLALSIVGALFLIIVAVVWFRQNFKATEVTLKASLTPSAEVKFGRKPDAPDKPAASSSSTTTITASGNTQIHQGSGDNIQNILPPQPQPPSGSSLPPRQRKFVHRGKVMDDVRAALKKGSAAIVGVGGMGGVGKTELAKFLADELKDEFADVMWVDVNDRPLAIVHGDMARKLGIKLPDNTDDQGRYSTLRDVLAKDRWLIVFDDVRKNFSLELCLPPEPCSALITSRLHDLAHVNKTIPLDVMTEDQSLELLRGEVSDEIVEKEIEAAKVLCALCTYHPLALVLAAARVRGATPFITFNNQLRDRIKQLRVDRNDKDASLEANFDLSYDELSAESKARWRKLAVFAPSGFALPAAAHLWSENETDAREHLYDLENASLISPSLLQTERMRLHDLLRDYAFKKLNEENESDAAYRAHANYLIQLFTEYYSKEVQLSSPPAFELDNLRETAEWANVKHDGNVLARLITQADNWIRVIFGIRDQYFTWLDNSLQFGIEDKQLKANVLKAMGVGQQFRKELDAALKSCEQALKLYQETGDKVGEANVLHVMGDVQQFRKEMDAALKNYEQALKLYREASEKMGEANALKAMGDVQQFRKEMDAALKNYEQALKLYREVSEKVGEANVLHVMGDVQQFYADRDAALKSYEQALSLFRAVGEKVGEANVLQAIGDIQQFGKNMDTALKNYEQALKLYREAGDKVGEANVLKAMGDVQQFRKESDAALKSYEQALSLFRAVGDKLGEANVLQATGNVQQSRKESGTALKSYEQALKSYREISDKLGEANVLKAIGDGQQFRKELDAALKNYEQALKLFKDVGDKLGEANVLLEMSRLELRRGDLAKAEIAFGKIVAMRHLMGDVFSEGRDYYYFARTLIEVDKKKEAKPYALKAKTCFEQVGEKFLVEYADKLIAACD